MLLRKISTIAAMVLVLLLIYKLHPQSEIDKLKCPDCNVILIGVDTLRADHLVSYGYKKIKTPNIDSLAQSGVLFKNNFSQSINTTPSFMSIFTSLYPTDHGILFTATSIGVPSSLLPNTPPKLTRINDNLKTLPEIFKSNSYQTQAFVTSVAVFSKFGFGKGFDSYTGDNTLVQQQNFINWIENYKEGKFFAFFHDVTPHSPYNEIKKYADDITIKNGKVIPEKDNLLVNSDPNNPSDIKKLTQMYDKDVEDIDKYVGTIVTTLKKKGLMEKTIIVFTSDHGEEFGDHEELGHRQFYNEIIHVPLIIYIPNLKKSVIIDQNTRSIDIMPTLLDIVRIREDIPMRGISLLSMIINPMKDLNLPIISIMQTNKSIIWNNYKFIDQPLQQAYFNKPITQELYDLKNDPKEKINLIGKNLPIKNELSDLYNSLINKKGYSQPSVALNNPELEQDVMNRVRSLGY